jgi:chromate transporter
MIYIKIFWAFFISNMLGYGGGPSTIPLIQAEVVDHYHWITLKQFGDVLAIANALPGPIATKMGGFIGYQVGGIIGCILALIATVVPSAMAMVILFKFVRIFKGSPYVKETTKSVQPIVAVLLGVMTYQFLVDSWHESGLTHTAILAVVSFLAMEWKKVNPAIVIAGSLVYGAVFLS